MITDVGVDPAGNVWAANNWDNLDAVVSNDPPRPISTQAGGQGIVVIYGVAAPVKTRSWASRKPASIVKSPGPSITKDLIRTSGRL